MDSKANPEKEKNPGEWLTEELAAHPTDPFLQLLHALLMEVQPEIVSPSE